MTATLADPAELAARLARLDEPAMAPIERWRAAHRSPGRALPHADPADGGADARVLLLLETPGPSPLEADRRFVSRDNATGTARNLRRFCMAARLAREDTVIWNAVPWVIHAPGARNRAVTRAEVAAGLALLPGFLHLLPRLKVAVLAGRPAQAARPVIARCRPGLPLLTMPHPSPTHVCTNPAIAPGIVAVLREAAALPSSA